MGEVGDGGKEGDITREEGFGRVSEDTQRLKKNYCYQLLSVFVFITVHSFSPPISDCLCRPTPLHASHQSTPVSGTIIRQCFISK